MGGVLLANVSSIEKKFIPNDLDVLVQTSPALNGIGRDEDVLS